MPQRNPLSCQSLNSYPSWSFPSPGTMLSLQVARPSVVAALYPWVVPLVPNQLTSTVCVKKLVHLLQRMGDLSVTHSGILQWLLPSGNMVALRQFRDNLLVAAKGPSPQTAMYPVCMTMESIWNLRVLYPCRDKDLSLVCHGRCMQPTVWCMGVSIYVSPTCTLAHTHPNALHDVWRLKFGAPLQSSSATTTRPTTNVFVSALSITLPFIHSWGPSFSRVQPGCSLRFSHNTRCLLCARPLWRLCTASWQKPPGTCHSLCAGSPFYRLARHSQLVTPSVTYSAGCRGRLPGTDPFMPPGISLI